MADLRVDIVSDFVGKKAFDKAGKSVSSLDKAVSKLGKQLGSLFAVSQVVRFGKASAQAFLEAEKANTRLGQVVDNLGLSFATAGIQKNLDEISASAGIAGEILVDAFQPLLTATGSVIKSQELLQQALDVSAGSGVDLATAANDLAQAFVGNTRGLRKYNLGLTQAELQAASFADVQERLTELFSGSNAKFLTTYAGQMQVLTEAAGNAQEIIGGALIDSLITLGNDTSVEDLATSMGDLATYTGNVIRGVGNLAAKLDSLPKIGGSNILAQLLTLGQAGKVKSILDLLAKSGGTKQSTGFSFFGSPMEETQKKRNAAAAAKAEKDAAKRAKAIIDSQKKNTAELKKQAALKKASTIFDLDQIQIIAALKGKLSEDEKLRLQLQLALIQGNEDYAKKLSEQLALSQYKTENLATLLAGLPKPLNPFTAWISNLDEVEARLRRISQMPPPATFPSGNVPSSNAPSDDSGFRLPDTMPGQSGSGAQFGPNTPWAQAAQVVVQIDGKAIASALLDQSMSAGQVAYLDRRTGGF